MSEVSKSHVMIGTIFGPKRRRTSSLAEEKGVSYFDMVKE